MTDDQKKREAIESVQTFLEVYRKIMEEQNYSPYDKRLMESLRFVDADSTGATWELDVTDEWINMNGAMHGGAHAVIFDMCTAISMNPISKPGYWDFLGGVSRSLNISYLKAVPPGTTVRIRCEVIQHGQRMAMLRGVMESPDGKTIYSTAEHHKTNVPTNPGYADRLHTWRETKSKEKSRI